MLLLLCPPQALVVHFEADTERRKLGLLHRVNFLGRSSLEPEYTQTEEVELHRQRHPVCTTATFQLHVSIWKRLVVLCIYEEWNTHFTKLLSSVQSLTPESQNFMQPSFDQICFWLSYSVSTQENIQDKLRPISLAITHTIKPVPPRRHSGKRPQRLPPVLNLTPSNKLHSEVCNKKKKKSFYVMNYCILVFVY